VAAHCRRGGFCRTVLVSLTLTSCATRLSLRCLDYIWRCFGTVPALLQDDAGCCRLQVSGLTMGDDSVTV
jgi:hypothetical protein